MSFFGDIVSAVAGPAVGGILGLVGGEERNEAAADQAQLAYDREVASAREQMTFQREMVEAQMNFQERMAGTAHRRQVQDLYAAGLNPILSARYGGAPSPGGASAAGAMARAQAATVENAMQKGVSNALNVKRLQEDVKLMRQNVNVGKATEENLGEQKKEIKARTQELQQSAALKNSQQHLNDVYSLLGHEQILTETERRSRLGTEAQILAEKLKGFRIEGKIDEGVWGTITRYLKRLNPLGSTGLTIRGVK